MLTGSLPFMADTAEAVMRMHVETNVVPPRQRLSELTVSDAIEALVLRCRQTHAEDRFASMSELAQVLTAEIDGLEGRNRSHGQSPSSRSAIVRGWPRFLREVRSAADLAAGRVGPGTQPGHHRHAGAAP